MDKALDILRDPGLKSQDRKKERRDQLRRVIYARFDFAEMAKRSLGSHWRRRTPDEREEFVRLFTDLLESAYVDKIESLNDENVVYSGEDLDGDYAEVQSRIVTSKGEELSLNYKVRLVNGEWKVYDVIAENISMVNNYRSQFHRVITNTSYEELIRKMKEKKAEDTKEEKEK